ncbi:MAG: phosphoribosylformylglycinamidine synthase, partial [Chitinivibrionales bacterium]
MNRSAQKGRVLGIKRIFSEKRKGFNVKAQNLFADLRENLGLRGLENLRILIRYDIEGISKEEYDQALTTVFSEPPVDEIYEGSFDLSEGETCFAVEFLPGQYDQRADSASQCIQIMAHSGKHKAPPSVKTAEVIVISGTLSEEDVGRIKEYVINPVDSHEAPLEIPETLSDSVPRPSDIERVTGFTEMNTQELVRIKEEMGLAMSTGDLVLCRDYFKKREKGDPTETEVVLLDTYWSDHCRHTTFMTKLTDIRFEDSVYTDPVKQAYNEYLKSREFVYKDKDKPVCLMDMATIGMKELRKKGLLDDLEESDEINACSISVTPEINGKEEEWLVMFKNETHNHPTEIEPFGGAATCLGGAIRDPLSGRSY